MAQFTAVAPHTPEECLDALDDMDKFRFGCRAGNHTGWALLEAKSEAELREMLPASLRDKAPVTAVGKFTLQEVDSFRRKAA